MTITWADVAGFLKIVPGLLLFPFSIYFAAKKIGYSVGCKVSVRMSRVLGIYIDSIIFQNHKDRPIAITEIFGIQNNVKFQIEEPKPPILLKSLETIVVKPELFTKYVCNGKRFEVDMADIASLQIFVVTPEKTILCKHIYRPAAELDKYHKERDVAHKIIRRFNDVVYGEKSLFAIVHYTGKECKTTTIDVHGFIDDSDLFGCNHIPKGNLTPEGIKAYLKGETGMDVTAFGLRHD
jgi:hypothetical protein